MESFRELGLSEDLSKQLERSNITEPSEIQEKVIPIIMEGKDVIAGSATGSGKTLAFGSGIIEKTIPGKGLQALILTPTRELAEQVCHVFERFSSYKRLRVSVVYGGVNIGHQVSSLKKAEIVVGTPGRILDHLERGTINLREIKTLVLDEADRMLDMGFIKDVETIIRNCSKDRQTLLFSATISADIGHIADKHMKNPEAISVKSYVSTSQLKQIYYDVPRNLKFSLLVHLLKKEASGLVMVFCNTRHNTDFVGENLKRFGIDSIIIHGGLTQQKRSKIIEKFHDKKVHVLVCTDVAARGLDIKGVSHIYNYDIPKTSQEYIHRIGRTARAGKNGIAINVVSDRDYDNFRNVTKDKSLNIEAKDVPKVETVRLIIKQEMSQRRNRWDSDNWRERNANRNRPRSGPRRQSSPNRRPNFSNRGGPSSTNRRPNSNNRRPSKRNSNFRGSKGRSPGQRTFTRRNSHRR